MKFILPVIFVLALSAFCMTGISAAEDHSHHEMSDTGLHLNNGQKWQTDDNFKIGMSAIQGEIKTALEKGQSPDYKILAGNIQKHIDFIVGNCKLTPETDEQAHMILIPIMDGIAMMDKGEDGVAEITKALKLYPEYFDHPGWAETSPEKK